MDVRTHVSHLIFGRGWKKPKKETFRRRWVHCARRWITMDDYEPFQMRKLIFKHHCRLCELAAHPFHRNRQQF